jgi:hypothetical protein
VTHFEVGMIKAPFMALVIGIVASNEGLRSWAARVLGKADNNLGRKVGLSRHRARRRLCRVRCIDRNVTMDRLSEPFAIRVRNLVVGFGQ